jgi:hypothetical protein
MVRQDFVEMSKIAVPLDDGEYPRRCDSDPIANLDQAQFIVDDWE